MCYSNEVGFHPSVHVNIFNVQLEKQVEKPKNCKNLCYRNRISKLICMNFLLNRKKWAAGQSRYASNDEKT